MLERPHRRPKDLLTVVNPDQCRLKTEDVVRAQETWSAMVPTLRRIVQVVAEHFEIDAIAIVTKRSFRSSAIPRHVAMACAREVTKFSMPEMARRFGGFDLTVVHYAQSVCRKEPLLAVKQAVLAILRGQS